MRRPIMVRATLLPVVAVLAAAVPAQQPRWPYSMDYGPCQMTTVDFGGRAGVGYKTVAVRLPGGGVAFDTELLRVASAWSGGHLRLLGTAYDGSHGPIPRRRGREFFANAFGPGCAKNGTFDDPRPIPHGPLPRDWGRYRGWYLHGDRVVVAYQIGGAGVAESYAITETDATPLLLRTLNLEACDQERWLAVADGPEGIVAGSVEWTAPAPGPDVASLAILQWRVVRPELVATDVAVTAWEELTMGGPSEEDFADRAAGQDVTIDWVPGFSRPHGVKIEGETVTPDQLRLEKLNDGIGAQKDDDWERNVWFDSRRVGDKDRDNGRIHVDLRRAVEVHRVSTYSWHFDQRAPQDYDLYGSEADTPPALDASNLRNAGWQHIADVRTGDLGGGDRHGASVARRSASLGRFQHLLLDVRRGGTFFSEIDVWAGDRRAPVDREPQERENLAVAVVGPEGSAELSVRDGRILLRVPPHREPLRLCLWHCRGGEDAVTTLAKGLSGAPAPENLGFLTTGGPARWGDPIATEGVRGTDDGAYAVDTLTIPFDNPYGSRMRTCAFDFFADGSAAVTTWNGDVWIVSGIDDALDRLQWRRFATGLFDPLGLKIVDGLVYVHGRDGITRLHDLNADGEADFYECFNNDVYVTKGFHEFAFDLQTDAAGNFYFSKGGPVNPGGRGFQKIAPHHGTIMKVSPDGERFEVIATGLRAPNGIGVGPQGQITSGENEGTWVPRCRLNYFTEPGYYAGVKDTAHRSVVPDQPDLPLCWMPMEVDNSSGSQIWVTSDRWGQLQGRLLHLSYGTCSLYLVLPDRVGDQIQGGVVRLPLSFSSSCMRARFHPVDGQLYLAGFQGWQTSAAKEGGFHRVRYTGKSLDTVVELRATDHGLYLTFPRPLDREVAEDPSSFGVEIWNYIYSQNYGSPEVSILHPERKVEQGKPNRDSLAVSSVKLSQDGRTVFLEVPGIQPVMQMRISWNLESADGGRLRGELHNSIHALAPDSGFAGGR